MNNDKVNILLVDDHVENLVALEALLTDLDQNLVRVESGIEALRLLLHNEFALIILDVDMPYKRTDLAPGVFGTFTRQTPGMVTVPNDA